MTWPGAVLSVIIKTSGEKDGVISMIDWKVSDALAADYDVLFKDGEVTLSSARAASNAVGKVVGRGSVLSSRGKRLKFSAEIKTVDADSAGLWLTGSAENWHVTDGMYDRLIKGSTGWSLENLVIDVPEDTRYVSFGLWMIGNGSCTMRNPKIEIVDQSVPVTGREYRQAG